MVVNVGAQRIHCCLFFLKSCSVDWMACLCAIDWNCFCLFVAFLCRGGGKQSQTFPGRGMSVVLFVDLLNSCWCVVYSGD